MNSDVQKSHAPRNMLWRFLARYFPIFSRGRRISDEVHAMNGDDRVFSPDVLLIEANQVIAVDGNIIEGAAYVDESAITGQSAPVIREAGRVSRVVRGSRVVAGCILVEVASQRSRNRSCSARFETGGKPDMNPSGSRSRSTARSTSN
jgi:magnesium-transporting ATPase (P-type)